MSATEELPTFDVSQKKKKKTSSSTKDGEEKKERKSKKTVTEEPATEEKEKKKKKKSSSADAPAAGEEAEAGDAIDFGKKKKKRSSKSSSSDATTEADNTEDTAQEETSTTSTGQEKQVAQEAEDINEEVTGTPWVGTDRDYKYSELTYRIYHLLQAGNPELISDQKRAMKTPKVFREGSRKTVWANFAEICQILNRKTDHVLSYVFAELGTNGSVDGNQNLVIKGRFQQQQMEVVIRHYIAEYVACRNCKSPNTTLDRNNRLYFLCCNVCNSKRSVAVIKKGLEVGKKQPKDN
ncbi:eIF-3 beta [Cavenderia fasciculata]|uniref:EIF-3 beta n=1 Tax=Cavenderia fasciculata TaxID=261658 RepID=F4Q650_CACFS|nr:eIF-3 beta [Cavenderia fasciculata]EGG16636.1 eIF-3 beta [Cavenderia fasciculata]|eukprot:XP_004355110.1 eIF-3 beta [Cavenderia fasciculata]